MASNAWPEPDLKSCKSCGGTWNDGLDQLPDEVLLSILSCLTMKEAARTSALSRRWRELWPCFPGTFNFEDPKMVLERSSLSDQAFFGQDTVNFVTWVTGVVDQHRGPAVEEFKVSFDLSNTYQSLIDKWVVFALTKGAKSLVLDFNPTYRIASTMYALPLKCCDLLKSPYNLPSWKPALKTLFLKHVSVATDILDCFLQSCPFLENLYIDGPTCLTSITASGSLLALKHLDVYGCPNLERIEIIAPKLVTFRYRGRCIQLDIQNASLLSEVTVGGAVQDPIAYAFDSLSQYFSQLKYFNVMTRLYVKGPAIFGADLPMNMVIPPVSNLMNLEHLKLTIFARPYQTLVGWITLIEACPVLQKLTLEEPRETDADFERKKGVLQEEMAAFRMVLRNAQSDIRSFMKLPSRFPPGTRERAADFCGETPVRPSPSLEQKVSGFEEYLEECHQQMTKFEETLLDFEGKFSSDNPTNLQRLSETMSTVQKYLIHETAEVEQIREQVEWMKRAHLADEENERCEQAGHEVAAVTSLPESSSYGGEFSLTRPPLNRYTGTLSSSPFSNRALVLELSLLSARSTSFPFCTLSSPLSPTLLSAMSPASILTSDIFSQSGSGSSLGAACATRSGLDIRGGARIEDLLPPPRNEVDWSFFHASLPPWQPTGITLFSIEESSSRAASSTHSRAVSHMGRRLLDMLPPPRAEIPAQSRSQQQQHLTSQILQQVHPEQGQHSPIMQEPKETNANLERHKGVLQEEIAAFRSALRNAQSDLQSFMELLDFDENFSGNGSTNLRKVSEIMTTVQKYLICKTAEIEQIHEQVQTMKRAHFADVEDGRCEQASHEVAAATSLSESFSYGRELSPTHPPSNRYAGISSSSPSLNHTMVPELSSLSPRHTLSESLLDLLPPPRTEIPPQSQPQPQQRQQQQNLSSQMLQQVREEHSECLISEKGLSWEGHLSGDGAVVKSLDEFKSMDESVPAHVVIHIHPDTPESERNNIKAVINMERPEKNRQVMGL